MKPTTIVLIRHGLTGSTGKILPGRAPGLHLSDAGREQAQGVADRLVAQGITPHAIYSSPLERTRETAQPTAKAFGLRVIPHKGLLEADFGDWTGKPLAQLRRKKEWNAVQHAPSTFTFPRGESFAAMQARIWRALEDISSRHPGRTVLAFSHADPIKAAVTFAQGVPLDLFQRTDIAPCSMSVLQFSDHAPFVRGVNLVGSLKDVLR